MSDDSDSEFERKPHPPPLFLNDAERDFRKQVTDEVIERVVGQKISYYPIDIRNSNFHPLYGEATDKVFREPLAVKALIDWRNQGELELDYEDNVAFDVNKGIIVHFHKRRLTEDQKFMVNAGDFICYGSTFYEIAKTLEPSRVFGQINHRLEISAHCIRARQSIFDGES